MDCSDSESQNTHRENLCENHTSIPLPVEEISAKSNGAFGLGYPTFPDRGSAAASHCCGSYGFNKTQPQVNFPACNPEFQVDASAVFLNTHFPLTEISDQAKTISGCPNLSWPQDSTQMEVGVNFQGELIDEITDYIRSNETGQNVESKVTAGMVDCNNVLDLLDLPLYDDVLQEHDYEQDELSTFFNDCTALSKHGSTIAHQRSSSLCYSSELSVLSEVNQSQTQTESNARYFASHSEDLALPQKVSFENDYSHFRKSAEFCSPSSGSSNELPVVQHFEASPIQLQNNLPISFHESQPGNNSFLKHPNGNPSPSEVEFFSIDSVDQNNSIPAADPRHLQLTASETSNQSEYLSLPSENPIDIYQIYLNKNESQFPVSSEVTTLPEIYSYDGTANTRNVMKFPSVSDSCTSSASLALGVSHSQPNERGSIISISETFPAKISTSHAKATSDNSPRRTRSSSSGEKICGVCGDVAKSKHFGGMACDSCKTFFRRSVQGKYWKKFRCMENKACEVSKANRRDCQFCRFEKCCKNGMTISWVMSDEERLELWKKRRAKYSEDKNPTETNCPLETNDKFLESDYLFLSNHNGSQKRNHHKFDFTRRWQRSWVCCKSREVNYVNEFCWCPPSRQLSLIASLAGESKLMRDESIRGTSVKTCSVDHPLSDGDRQTINLLLQWQCSAFSRKPFSKLCRGDTVEASLNVYVNITEKLRSFFHQNVDYLSLLEVDRTAICRSGGSGPLVLFPILYNFEKETHSWPRDACVEAIKVPYLSADTIAKVIKSKPLYHSFMNFCCTFCGDIEDEGVLAMFHLLALLYETHLTHKFENEELVTKCTEKYLHLLIRYLRFREGEKGYLVTLPRLLSAISEAKKLASKITLNLDTVANQEGTRVTTSQKDKLVAATTQEDTVTTDQKIGAALQPRLISSNAASVAGSSWVDMEGRSYTHHPMTKVIFGPRTATDALLVDPMEQILQFEGNSLPEVRQKEHSINSKKDTIASTSVTNDIMEQTREKISRVTVLETKQNQSPLPVQKISWSEEKKIGIQVLCEMLQWVAQSDDPRAMECLLKYFPEKLIQNLTRKELRRSEGKEEQC